MKAFTIPVAFLVEADSEDQAASMLVSRITAEFTNGSEPGPRSGAVESWWLPNHPPFTHGGDLDMPRLHWSNESTMSFMIDGVTNEYGVPNLTAEQKNDLLENMPSGPFEALNFIGEDVTDALYDAGYLKREDAE